MKGISLFILCSFTALGWAVQNKTYPTSAVTQIRVDTYMDSIVTIAKSTWTIRSSTWSKIDGDYFWIEPSTVNVWQYNWETKTSTRTLMGIDEYTNLIRYGTMVRDVFDISDNMDEYFVWPDTFTVPSNWPGWCLQIINGRNVPVNCPKK